MNQYFNISKFNVLNGSISIDIDNSQFKNKKSSQVKIKD